ncbi:MAG: hypothetical protein WCO78_04795 [Candidatus Roizmanbacteria bacterium]
MNTHLISQTRSSASHPTLIIGQHRAVMQSMLDFDYLCGKTAPDIYGLITGTRGVAKLFWGKRERLIPTYRTVSEYKQVNPEAQIKWFVHVSSARRVKSDIEHMFSVYPEIQGGVVFAEGVTEQHALSVSKTALEHDALIVGPATVGLLVPGSLKLGAIGGVDPAQWEQLDITTQGDIAVISGSGGMTGELISLVYQSGHKLSFALSFGGDRWPICTPQDAFLLAEHDPETKVIVYYGELGGEDEYLLKEMIDSHTITKPVIAHIGGTIGEIFPESPQFGHAKAKAHLVKEKASEKRKALSQAGVHVTHTFSDVLKYLKSV